MKYRLLSVVLGVAWLFAAPVPTPLWAKEVIRGPRIATVLRVIDGDSIEVETMLWLGNRYITIVRLAGIDTPELRGKCEAEKRRARQAKDALVALLAGESHVAGIAGIKVQLFDIHRDKYWGRVIAKVLMLDGQDVVQHLIDTGHAQRYDGGKRPNWCNK